MDKAKLEILATSRYSDTVNKKARNAPLNTIIMVVTKT